MSGAWSKGASSAVASAPAQGRFAGAGTGGGGDKRDGGNNRRGGPKGRGSQDSRNSGDSRNNSQSGGDGRGGGRGGRGGRGRGGGRNGGKNDKNNNSNSIRIFHKDVQLLNEKGNGNTKEQQRVKRFSAKDFMRLRFHYLEVSDSVPFTPHEQCHWTDEDRAEIIQSSALKAIELGDVSKIKNNRPETAPPVENCAPLAVNEETRWKTKSMKKKAADGGEEDTAAPETNEEILAKTRLILNKISLTTLDRMTDDFIEQGQVETNDEVRKEVIHLLIQKSQREHHFGPMYAELCAKIAKQIKPFKKELLSQCQKEFELDTAHKIAQATEGITEKEEIEYHSTLIRKSYVGHIKFLGELYKRDVVKLAVMMYCLDELLKDEEDEDNIECFANLMTTMGEKLDVHAKQNKKPFDWDKVVSLRKSQKISNRIRFLLQDLLELKNNGWVSRRKKEVAVNLKDLHNDIAQEEGRGGKPNKTNRDRSTKNLKRSTSVTSVPVVDNDGFVEISRASVKKVSSKIDMMSLDENSGAPAPPTKAALKRSQSQPAPSNSTPPSSSASKKGTPALSPDECFVKAKNMLKEYFVGGDTADAVLTVNEIVQAGSDGAVERGAKVIEGGVFLVIEMKREQVEKCAVVLCRAFQEEKLPAESVVQGLSDPLEFLSDIEIDAPLAGSHLAHIVAEFVKVNALQLDTFLQGAPASFKDDGKPAVFCSKVLKAKGGEPSDADIELVGSLMTDDDKAKHASPKALYDSVV